MEERGAKDEGSTRSRQEPRKKRKEDSFRKRKDKENAQEAEPRGGRAKLCQTAEVAAELKSLREKDPYNRTCNKEDLFSGLLRDRKSKSKSKEDRKSRKSMKFEGDRLKA
jgi:hypothetical protein